MYETGEHAARLLFDRVHGRARPVIAWSQPPLLTHTLRSTTDRRRDAARGGSGERGRSATACWRCRCSSGFSLADIEAPCISVVVVGDGDREAAQRVAKRIAQQIWGRARRVRLSQ